MEILKAGCYVLNKENKTIALIYRDYYNDYTFPKGHVEEGEDTVSCAIRETAEEIKRDVLIIPGIKPIEEHYITSGGQQCVCFMYLALDNGHSDNQSFDTHELVWVSVDEVEGMLSFESLKLSWRQIKPKILEIINKV